MFEISAELQNYVSGVQLLMVVPANRNDMTTGGAKKEGIHPTVRSRQEHRNPSRCKEPSMTIKFSLFDAVVKMSSARLPCETWHSAVHAKPSTPGHGRECPHRTATRFVLPGSIPPRTPGIRRQLPVSIYTYPRGYCALSIQPKSLAETELW